MVKRVEALEKIRKTLAVLSDDVQWKLDDIVQTIGDLIDAEREIKVDSLRKIAAMSSHRRRLLSYYLTAVEERNSLLKQRIEDLWQVEDNELQEVIEDLQELSRDSQDMKNGPPAGD